MDSSERRRMEVAESDDRDSRAEVEILAAVRIPDACTLAADDRDVRPGVRRKQPLPAL